MEKLCILKWNPKCRVSASISLNFHVAENLVIALRQRMTEDRMARVDTRAVRDKSEWYCLDHNDVHALDFLHLFDFDIVNYKCSPIPFQCLWPHTCRAKSPGAIAWRRDVENSTFKHTSLSSECSSISEYTPDHLFNEILFLSECDAESFSLYPH